MLTLLLWLLWSRAFSSSMIMFCFFHRYVGCFVAQFFDLRLLRLFAFILRCLCSSVNLLRFLLLASNDVRLADLLFSIELLLEFDCCSLLSSMRRMFWCLLYSAGFFLIISILLRLCSKYSLLRLSIASLFSRYRLAFGRVRLLWYCCCVFFSWLPRLFWVLLLILLSTSLLALCHASTLSTAFLLNITCGLGSELSFGACLDGSIQYSPCSVLKRPACR